jgi:predicted transcriptional regulator
MCLWEKEQRLMMFKNRVLRKITESSQLHNEELWDLSSSPITILVIKSIRMRCMGHVAHYRGEKSGSGLEKKGRASSCKCSTTPLRSLICRKFEQLQKCYLLTCFATHHKSFMSCWMNQLTLTYTKYIYF